nr:ribonuclease H-like domain-containing protein [Tanacetum cinerariifolium]
MDLESTQNNAVAKLPLLKQGDYEMWKLRIEQYFQVQYYALWDVIENGNSFKLDAKTLFEAIQARFSGNDATKKTQRTLLKQMYDNFNAPSTESLDSIFNSTNEVDTASIHVSAVSILVSTVSSHDNTANLSDAIMYAFLENQPNGSQLVHEDLEQIHKDDLEEMDFKWQLALLSMRARRSPKNQESRPRNQDSSRKTVNVEDTYSKAMVAIDGAGFDWSYMADDEVPNNMALMAFSNSKFNKSEFDLATFKRGLGFTSYNVVAPSPTGLFAPPTIDLSNSGLEYDEDEDDEMVLKSEYVQYKPEQANQPRKVSQNPRNNKTNWNEMST